MFTVSLSASYDSTRWGTCLKVVPFLSPQVAAPSGGGTQTCVEPAAGLAIMTTR